MWNHFCEEDRNWISVADGEPCNWCDEQESKDEIKEDKEQPCDQAN